MLFSPNDVVGITASCLSMFKDKVLYEPLHHIFAEVWITVSIFSKLEISILGLLPQILLHLFKLINRMRVILHKIQVQLCLNCMLSLFDEGFRLLLSQSSYSLYDH